VETEVKTEAEGGSFDNMNPHVQTSIGREQCLYC
jgi:hypothetical protein